MPKLFTYNSQGESIAQFFQIKKKEKEKLNCQRLCSQTAPPNEVQGPWPCGRLRKWPCLQKRAVLIYELGTRGNSKLNAIKWQVLDDVRA